MEQGKDMMPMVRVTRFVDARGGSGGIKAFADVVVAEHFAVKGIRLMQGPKGVFVSMPGRKNDKGEYVETFHPVTKAGREVLHSVVKAAYKFGKGGQGEARA